MMDNQLIDSDITRRLQGNEDKIKANRKIAELNDSIKHILNGRKTIIALIIFTIIGGLSSYYRFNNDALIVDFWAILIDVCILLICYFGAFFLSKKRPKSAFITAITVYILYMALMAFMDPKSLISGFIVKIIIMYYLGMAITGSINYKNSLHELEQLGVHREKIQDGLDLKKIKKYVIIRNPQ